MLGRSVITLIEDIFNNFAQNKSSLLQFLPNKKLFFPFKSEIIDVWNHSLAWEKFKTCNYFGKDTIALCGKFETLLKNKEKRTKAFSEWAKLYATNEYPICYMLYDNLLYGTNKWYIDLKLIECNSSFLILI